MYFTSESVTEGHPDKVADRISDSILDAFLHQDPMSRVAVETLVTTEHVVVAGEVTSSGHIDVDALVRDTIADIGYDRDELHFSAETVGITNHLHSQSADIAGGVTTSLEARAGSEDPLDQLGAGDQGMMFGYAVGETDELMPAPIHYAHRLAEQLAAVRHQGTLGYLRPDGKTQVTVEYDGSRVVRLSQVLISSQHAPDVGAEDMAPDLWTHVVEPVVPAELLDDTRLLVNPSGRFEIGGPHGDAGLTGRKIIVDTYGGAGRHGGGAFSGKDPTKVDRSAAYAARQVAKTVVAAGLAERCELQVAYAIGQAKPFSLHVDSFGTGNVDPFKLAGVLDELFDLRPAAIIDRLDLRRPVYAATSAYGHFGRPEFSWEQTDMAEKLAEVAETL